MKLTWQNAVSLFEVTLGISTDCILKQGDVHLWKASLNYSNDTIKYLLDTLSVDEKERAKRFYQEKHSRGFIIARGLLRVILGHYITEKPSSIIFKYSSKGKPTLADISYPLSFNLSHSQERVIYGLGYVERIGVDLEYQREITDVSKLAERFFSPKEYQYLQNRPEIERNNLFLRLWTAKEAYLKATGEGIAGGLELFEVRIGDTGELSYTPPWLLSSFLLEQGYYAAVASSEKIENMLIFPLNDDDQVYREPDHNRQGERDDKREYA